MSRQEEEKDGEENHDSCRSQPRRQVGTEHKGSVPTATRRRRRRGDLPHRQPALESTERAIAEGDQRPPAAKGPSGALNTSGPKGASPGCAA